MLRVIVLGVFACFCLSLWGCSSSVGPASVSQIPDRTSVLLASQPQVRQPLIYVSNTSDTSITAYAVDDVGDAAPKIRIAGPDTLLTLVQGIAFDNAGRLYACCGQDGVEVFARGANGDARPIATIGCNGDFVGGALAISRGPDQDVVLGQNFDALGKAISWVEQGALGCARVHTIAGDHTNIDSPTGVAVDARGFIFAANAAADFGVPGITEHRRDASGDSRPIRFISGPHTSLFSGIITEVALDSSGQIYVLSQDKNGDTGFISIFDRDADGDVAPVRILRGPESKLSGPFGIASDTNGMIYVGNRNNTITVYDPKTPGALKPVRLIGGPHTRINQPDYLAIFEPN